MAQFRRARRFGYVDTRSTGAAIWEMLHPEQVQREYQAVGQPVPSYGEIYSNALNDAISAARESASNVGEAAQAAAEGAVKVGSFAMIAIALAAVVFLLERKK